ncbi:polyadenylate-binding protein 2 [Fistulifera solaris]|uniref:Polyadenylate-binding protein 2 n=1 Tax=Fistulifera solaris TaxID=1519565 RepID=A0A1Z5JX16_FISSO|nr:polyadenylate-binding protein 2 [Fistulifera solaris]|eukprot:GAX18439.1 polyadenylate-binding protein 2 [Fistulifera solaris]
MPQDIEEDPTNNLDEDEEDDEEDLEKLQAEIARMEEEAARITKETEALEQEDNNKNNKTVAKSADNKPARDNCSIYVGQVDYSATPEELLKHFDACGTVERVTIVCDKYTGRPKGFAYLEFQNEAAVENAVKMDGSEFKGRQLKVTHKRVNVPAFQLGGGRGRGRGRGGFRGRGRGRGRGYHPY